MGFGAEMRDFMSAFGSVNKAAHMAAQTKYYNARAKALGGGFDYNSTANSYPGYQNPAQDNGDYSGANKVSDEDQQSRATDYMQYLVRNGVSPGIAGALVGNAWHESAGLNSTAAGDGGDSYGLFQFNKNGRLPELQKWASGNKREISDPKAQMDFVLYDLKTNYPDAYKAMQGAKSPAEAAQIFMEKYERPRADVAHLNRRLSRTGQAMELWNKAGGVRNPGSVSPRGGGYFPPSDPASTNRDRMGALDVPYDDEMNNEPMLYSARGGMVRRYEDAGLVDDDQSLDDLDRMTAGDGVDEGAIPESGGQMQVAQNNQPATLGEALDSGIKFLTKTFGLDQRSTAVGNDPDLSKRQEALMRGTGADHEGFEGAKRVVDPRGEMTDAQRNLYATVKGYEFYRDRGDSTKAARYAAMAIQAAGDYTSKYGALAAHAGEQGDIDGLIKYAKKAYDYTLDGKTADAEKQADGTIKVTQSDAQSGKPLQTYKVTPRQLINAVMGLTNKSAYYDQLMRVAATEPSVAARRLQMQQDQQAKIAGIQSELANMDDEGTVSGNTETTPAQPAPAQSTPSEAVPTTPAQAAPAQQAVPDQPVANPEDLPKGGFTPVPQASAAPVQDDSANAQAAVPDGLPKLERPEPKPFPEPMPKMSDKKLAKLRQLEQAGPDGLKVANAERKRFKTEVLDPWKARKAEFDKNERDRVNNEYNQSVLGFTTARSDRSRKDTQTHADKAAAIRQENADKAAAKREEFIKQRDIELQQQRQQHAIQLEQLKVSRPKAFFASGNDVGVNDTNKQRAQDVQDMIVSALTEAARGEDGQMPKNEDTGKPWEVKDQFSPDQLHGMRDATIAAWRYNGDMPLDTAAQAIMSMITPGPTALSKYKVEEIKDVPDDPTDGPRVKVIFENPNSVLTGLILPKSVLSRIDIIRGKQIKAAVEYANRKSDRNIAKDKRAIEENDIDAQLQKRIEEGNRNMLTTPGFLGGNF